MDCLTNVAPELTYWEKRNQIKYQQHLDSISKHVPAGCDFAVGDKVIFTNDYGVMFELTIDGFVSDEAEILETGRSVYLFKDSWWFPANPAQLTPSHLYCSIQ